MPPDMLLDVVAESESKLATNLDPAFVDSCLSFILVFLLILTFIFILTCMFASNVRDSQEQHYQFLLYHVIPYVLRFGTMERPIKYISTPLLSLR